MHVLAISHGQNQHIIGECITRMECRSTFVQIFARTFKRNWNVFELRGPIILRGHVASSWDNNHRSRPTNEDEDVDNVATSRSTSADVKTLQHKLEME